MNSLQPSAFNLAPPPTLQWQPVQTSNFIAVSGRAYPCNTTSATFTVTLPLNPNPGDQITLTDYAGTFASNPLTINPNGRMLRGLTSNQVISTSNNSVQLVYMDSTRGWIVYAAVSSTPFLPSTSTVEYLVVAGGGSGGNPYGGGGGAGGYKTASGFAITAGLNYSITVGAGGTGIAYGAGDGSNSVFSTITSTGGGGGGSGNNVAGKSGGSGGGGGGFGSVSGGTGTSGQGNAGGNGVTSQKIGAGGGGSSAAGNNGTSGGAAGAGGAGSSSSISGASETYAGGGGGGADGSGSGTGAGAGGSGGGGAGGFATFPTSGNGTAGTTNTGGGGGGSAQGGTAGNGGSGVVIISYADTYAAATTTGSPTITVTGGYRIYKFTGNGSITF